ncbi:hypothetical protein ACFSB1_11080 [Halopseudomonas phragmitis]|nr:hypothetical protein [Halopseudomonas phragmitis]
MSFSESGVVLFNISAGEGGGPSGDPASVEAIVRVDGFAATRTVVALERQGDGEWRVGGHTEISGGGELQLRTLGGPIYAVAIDDYGVAFTSALAVLVGQRIRPSQFRGWLYEITQAGQLPATEPEWWPIEGDNAPRELGTARAVAVRYYRPLAHGPVPVEMI